MSLGYRVILIPMVSPSSVIVSGVSLNSILLNFRLENGVRTSTHFVPQRDFGV